MASFLEFLGIETRQKALRMLGWAAPFLVLFLVMLAGLSYLVQRYVAELPIWMHLAAIACSLAVFLIFLAWGHRMATEAQGGEGEDP